MKVRRNTPGKFYFNILLLLFTIISNYYLLLVVIIIIYYVIIIIIASHITILSQMLNSSWNNTGKGIWNETESHKKTIHLS